MQLRGMYRMVQYGETDTSRMNDRKRIGVVQYCKSVNGQYGPCGRRSECGFGTVSVGREKEDRSCEVGVRGANRQAMWSLGSEASEVGLGRCTCGVPVELVTNPGEVIQRDGRALTLR